MGPFRLVEKTPPAGYFEVEIEGELDLAVADQLDEMLERVAGEHELIVISLERCEFIDSTGIAVIVKAHTRLAADGRRVVVHGANNQVRRVLSVTGLTENGLVFASLDQALQD
jgi:stage II sporulation protein AA (anti-sigma F factor antagonist)